MKAIDEWLEEHVSGFLGQPAFSESKAEFREAAQLLVSEATSAGYSVQDIKEACDGDVETYLMHRQNAMIEAEKSQMVDDDR